VATKTPPTRHAYKRIPRPAVIRAPQLQLPAQKPAPPQPAAQPISGLPIYGAQMHTVLQANQDVPPSLAQLGISGTAYVQIIVAPDGHPVSAKIYRSSGNALIDQTALQHAMQANYGAFNAQMPIIAQTFIIPVDIQPQDQ
jgi:protein TonB